MVRLRVAAEKLAAPKGGNFNSNMVRLRDYFPMRASSCFPNFNSNMVRLRVRRVKWVPTLVLSFQFQHGTIERLWTGPTGLAATRISIPTWYDWEFSVQNYTTMKKKKFQFQHGTIESKHKLFWNGCFAYFNSNMVRLRVGATGRSETQYYRISIPTWYDWEVESYKPGEYRNENFNSNMVRLRVESYKPGEYRNENFNSNMVRLRDVIVKSASIPLTLFQFQHGTIERADL